NEKESITCLISIEVSAVGRGRSTTFRITESKYIYFGTVDGISSWSRRPAGDTLDLYFTFLFVANDGKRDRQSGRTQLVAKVLWRGNPIAVHGPDYIAGLQSSFGRCRIRLNRRDQHAIIGANTEDVSSARRGM